ncbi:hypothetical protein M422DRAFT_68604 [Sphaerobolus stellatus SS14]|uniref:U3 small nucleolar RNA-associated protein 22 n=1 Tax=Sphaerobolus stellatus (strain SS14) TaxID=990650 RepID=A0A0C9VR01_SPHS4|nr:hypothetical protein M422DRAFT_68604 [Sphaerobolus stellatus SS14]
MVAVKRKWAEAEQRPAKKLHKDEDSEDEDVSAQGASEDDEPSRQNEDRIHGSKKLPTAGEIRAINEAANLYRSNQFKAQLDLLLPNVRPKSIHTSPLEKTLEKIYTHLTGLPAIASVHPLETAAALETFKPKAKKSKGKEKEKENVSTVEVAVPYPTPAPAQATAWKVAFEPPEPKGISIVGSWQDSMGVRKPDGAPFAVDVLVEMPATLFQEKDYRNLRVFHKRAFYLACLASSLQHTSSFNQSLDLKYESPEGDARKTMLVLTPKAGKEKEKSAQGHETLHPQTCVRIIPAIPEFFPLHRLSPSQANLRFNANNTDSDTDSHQPSPIYNSTLALSLVKTARAHLLNAHRLVEIAPGFKDALSLLKVWANQRGYISGFAPVDVAKKRKQVTAEYCVRGFEGLGAWWACLLEVLVMGEEFTPGATTKKSVRPTVGRGLSSYQLFRAALDFLSKRDFVKEPVFMKLALKAPKFNVSEWTARSTAASTANSFQLDEPYPVPTPVFIDSTGCLNMLAGVPAEALELLRHDALETLTLLNKTQTNESQVSEDSFDVTFLHDLREPNSRFDAVIKFNLAHIHASQASPRLYSFDSPSTNTQTLLTLLSTLRRALNTRIRAIVALQPRSSPRPIFTALPTQENIVTIGVIYEPRNAVRLVDIGPAVQDESADDVPQSASLDPVIHPWQSPHAFRTFWGPKSELRRFRDGNVAESCVWDEGIVRVEDRETIPVRILRYILGYRFGVNEGEIQVIGEDCASVVVVHKHPRGQSIVQGSFKEAFGAFEKLSRALKALEDDEESLPLGIVSCRAAENSSALRYMDIVPPCPITAPSDGEELGRYLDAFGVVLQLERFARWPDDVRAMQRIKMAFFESMARGLNRMKGKTDKGVDINIHARVLVDLVGTAKNDMEDCSALEVIIDGWAFRVRIGHDREAYLLENLSTVKKLPPVLLAQEPSQDPATRLAASQALALYRTRFIYSPAHHTAMLALHHKIPSFAYTIRLVKRWFTSHWLSARISEESIELICAGVILSARGKPGSPGSEEGIPATGKRGFIRVIEWLSRWDGIAYVNVYEVVQDDITPNQSTAKEEEEAAPAKINVKAGKGRWRLVTKEDKEGTIWCGDVNPTVALRVKALARATMDAIEGGTGSYKPFFIHPRGDYDFLIELDPLAVTRYWQNIHASVVPETQRYVNLIQRGSVNASSINPASVRVGFNPAELYFRDLQKVYGDSVEFFYDTYGGTTIGGVWNPSIVAEERPWRVRLGFSSVPEVGDKKSKSKPTETVSFNVPGVLGEIKRMGEGLVKKIVVVHPEKNAGVV